MGKESQPRRVFFVDEKAVLSVICHTCSKELYSAEEENTVTKRIADGTARNHGHSYNPIHNVSVIKWLSPNLPKEILTIDSEPDPIHKLAGSS